MPTVVVSKNTTGSYANSGYTGVNDTRMRGLSPTTNYASGTFVATNCWDVSSDDCGNTLIKFDVSAIGAGTVTNAEIGFYLTNGNNDFRGIDLYQLLVDFIDTEATFQIRKSGTNWNTSNARGSGTDRASTAVATATRLGTSGVWMTFTGTALNALIEDYLDGTTTNNGFTMEINGYADDLFTFQDYASSEGTDGQRPYLKFDHTPAAGSADLEGDATSIAAATGQLTTSIKLTAAAVAIAAASGQLSTQVRLNAAALDVVSASGQLSTQVRLGGNAVDTVTASGNLTTAIKLAGSAVNVANASGALSAQIKLQGNALSQALATASFDSAVLLNAAAQNTVVATAVLTTQIKFTGNAEAVATAAANLAGSATSFAGDANSLASAAAALSTQIKLSAGAQSVVTLTADITIEKPLTGAMLSQALATGQLQTNILFSGFAINSVNAVGNLTTVVLNMPGARRSASLDRSSRRPRYIQLTRRN